MEFKISPLNHSEKEEVYEFTKKWFFTSEPLTMDWKVIPDMGYLSYIRAIEHGLSLKVTDQDGHLAAVCINADDNRTNKTDGYKLPSNLQQLYNFFDQVSSELEENQSSNYMSILVVTVGEAYRKRGLCTRLLNSSFSVASRHGFSGVSVLCTSSHSAAAAEAADMKCVLRRPYSSYRHPVTGHQLYSPPPPHTHISVYTRPIHNKL